MQLYRSIAIKTKLLLLFLITGAGPVFAFVQPNVPLPDMGLIKLVENKGQWPKQVLFKANIPGGDLYITPTGLVYQLIDEAALHELAHNSKGTEPKMVNGHTYKMTFSNANAVFMVDKQGVSSETYNYFLGSDPNVWAGNCRAYQTVVLRNIYDGIDAEIVAQADFIKLNFIVHPYADPSKIVLAYEGMDALTLKEQGLQIKTTVATIREEKPVAFQQTAPVQCSYELESDQVHFNLGQYDKSQILTIDPEIIFGTYSGSVADNFGFTGTYDDAGNGYAGGTVYAANFPVTTGAYQLTFKGGGAPQPRDVGILKFSADGKQLLYATYLGGTGNEQPHSIICNSAGELYILGTTQSNNFPTSVSGFDRVFNGKTDIFVAKLSADGTQLLSSTYWGGANDDGINGTNSDDHNYHTYNPLTYNYGDFFRGEILLDASNRVWVVSATQSAPTDGYPLLKAFQSGFGGGVQDGVLFALSSNLSLVYYSTYLGGNGEDAAYGIRFDSKNNILVCGGTTSFNLPVTNPAFPYKGDVDGFIASITPGASLSLTKLIHLGTTAYDQAYFIDIDSSDRVYVTGQTLGNYPTKGSVFWNNKGRQFISILNKNMDSVMYSTVIGNGGGKINISPSAFMVDQCGKVYLSGWGGASNIQFNDSAGTTGGLTITSDAFQKKTDGSDFYLIILSENLTTLKYATFIGGTGSGDHVDGGTSRFDKNGIIYQSICAGCGGYSDLPVTAGCYSPVNKGKRPFTGQGGCNNAMVKFLADPHQYTPLVKDTLLVLIATDTLNYPFTITNPIGDSLAVTFSGSVLSIPNAPVITTTINQNKANILIRWITKCDYVSPDTFIIKAETRYNTCFGFRTETAWIKILVLPPPSSTPFPSCLKTINDSTIRISWKETHYGRYFKKLEVYKSVDGDSFRLLGYNLNEHDTTFTDAKAYNHLTQNICYYFVGTNICDSASPVPSRYICSLYQYDSVNNIFTIPNDTLIYMTATDTLDYIYEAETVNRADSVFISASGSVFATNRVISFVNQPDTRRSTYRIRWRSACDDLNLTDTLTIHFLVRDNQCPQSRTKQSRLRIIVLPPPLMHPPPMRCTRNTGPNSVLLRWRQPAVNKRYFSHFVLLRKNADGTYTDIANIPDDTTLSFEDKTAFNNETANTCYAMYGVNVCDAHGDTSDYVCTVIKTVSTPDPIYIYTTTVVNNDYLNIQWAKSSDPDFLKYQVFKKNILSGDDYTFKYETTVINDTILDDKGTDVHNNVYCYQLKQVNDCGVATDKALQSCSILLKGVSQPFVHTLGWNDYEHWQGGVDRYYLIRQQPNQNPEELNRYMYKNTVATDKQLDKDNGLYYYTIRAEERKSAITSVSNTVELIQAPLLHVPNVFTVNGDGLNDTWQPVPVFVKDYTLKIYNRWGQLVFETVNKKEAFTGEFDGNPTTADVFVYLITYTGWDGSVHTVNGNVTQLK
jgi:gliding motility-associated-like protein